MLAHAQDLVYSLSELMPSSYQKDNLEAMLGLFLQAQGHPLPEHSQTKSASALSRFLNINPWSTRDMIRTVRNHVLKQVLSERSLGRKPFLQVIIDLTTLEKSGKFKEFEHLIFVYNGKRGLHLVVLYLVVGRWRIPWSFRVWSRFGYSLAWAARTKTGQTLAQLVNVALSSHDFSGYSLWQCGIPSRYTFA